MMIFTLFFGDLAKIPLTVFPYPIFAYVASPWTPFRESLTQVDKQHGHECEHHQEGIFPSDALPISSVLSPLLDFGIAFAILRFMIVYFGIMPTTEHYFVSGVYLAGCDYVPWYRPMDLRAECHVPGLPSLSRLSSRSGCMLRLWSIPLYGPRKISVPIWTKSNGRSH